MNKDFAVLVGRKIEKIESLISLIQYLGGDIYDL